MSANITDVTLDAEALRQVFLGEEMNNALYAEASAVAANASASVNGLLRGKSRKNVGAGFMPHTHRLTDTCVGIVTSTSRAAAHVALKHPEIFKG